MTSWRIQGNLILKRKGVKRRRERKMVLAAMVEAGIMVMMAMPAVAMAVLMVVAVVVAVASESV
jgi:hypothetical protein